MSHEATNWAIKQRGLKPTTKIVLWHLSDRFNPDFGCFPSQERLANDCEISRSTLNAHLDLLEAARLLRRVPRLDPVSKRQMSTRYILGFEKGFTPDDPEPCPETGHGVFDLDHEPETGPENSTHAAGQTEPCPEIAHGKTQKAVSDFCPDPCPKNGQSRVRNPDTNPVREPLREPLKEEEDAAAREADFDRFFAELCGALGFAGNATLPSWWQGWPARSHVRRWIDDLGLSEDRIIEVATESRCDHPNPPDGPKALDRFMERAAQRDVQAAAENASGRKAKRSRKTHGKPPPSPDELAEFYAAKVNSDEYLPNGMISTAMCSLMLARGLVTAERLRLRGVR
ncbi:helix-turn-helix domain-containing protein [Roseovarius sp. SCSIO 43702]|uniref:helix-turn-helix domain-containing protein n=1 Tax=Roseovarius sp. SCSIO 43702 TaxID=2823043 RepID=UPI001C733D0A|nr:helix-turn-helix domain-containing protein [Roseovarius sp. SCSIO 43702]QYX56817.1 helix-turn-helix domain-containing protein [Roseovarius sp. SCSIO 43702]